MAQAPVIAIVDDDQAVREALAELLQVTGFESRCFERADTFLADAAADDFDCLITDVRMPGIDGLELHERLRVFAPAMPVIFITSAHDPVTRARALESGAHAFLSKPIADGMILEQLESALARRAPSRTRDAEA